MGNINKPEEAMTCNHEAYRRTGRATWICDLCGQDISFYVVTYYDCIGEMPENRRDE